MLAEHNLPPQMTSFVGRGEEIRLIREQVLSRRLLTLTGPGGIGKTRLAIRVADSCDGAFPDGRWLIELSRISEGPLVPHAIADVLGTVEQAGQSVTDTVLAALQHKRLLLVLDNCEHVLPAAAALAEAILRTCPRVTILATSREPLGVAGEVAWRVPSLTFSDHSLSPQGQSSADSEAVQLFVDRATSVGREFALTPTNRSSIVTICVQLDGVPLAIELAAARTRMLSVEHIAERLRKSFALLSNGTRNAPSRQQTMQATIEWSYHLLDEAERKLFERLSVFAGGWTLAAAEDIAHGESITHDEVLDILGRLVDKSLVMVERGDESHLRYRLLETLRQYGRERLQEHGEVERVASRHASYFTAYAQQAEGDFFGAREMAAIAALAPEQENLRTALRWLIGVGDAERAQQLGATMGIVSFFRSASAEGSALLDEVLAMPHGDQPTPWYAMCVLRRGIVAFGQGDHERTTHFAGTALHLWETLHDDAQLSGAHFMLGMVSRIAMDNEAATHHLREAIRLGHSGIRAFATLAWMGLAYIAIAQGDYLSARRHAEAGVTLARTIGWERGRVSCAGTLIEACFEQGDDENARRYGEETAREIRQQLASPWWLANVLVSLARAAIGQRDFARAGQVLTEATAYARAIGDRASTAATLQAWAYLAASLGDGERAIHLNAAGNPQVRGTRGTIQPKSARVTREIALAAARLDPAVREAASLRGRSMPLEDALELALTTAQVIPTRAGAPEKASTDALSPREREVVALVARGHSNQEIADALVISERTVESHVRNALGKLGLHSRAGLAAWAVAHHLTLD